MPKKTIQNLEMTPVAPQKKSLAQIAAKLNNKLGVNSKAILAADTETPVKMPTGILGLDYQLGGGFPAGKVVLLAGGEGSRKSTICLQTIAEAQKRGATAAWVDAESAFDRDWAEANGVDLDNLLILQPETAENAYDQMTTCVLEGVDIIVLDSLNTLSVKKEMFEDDKGLEAASITKEAMGVAQRKISQWLRNNLQRIGRTKCLLMIICQLRDNLNAGMYGNPTTVVGGRAVKFASSVTLMTRTIGGKDGKIMDDKEEQIGQRYEVKFEKNRFGKQGKTAEYAAYGSMIDNYTAMMELGVKDGFIQKPNNKTYICNGKSYNGKLAMKMALVNEPDLYAWCQQQIDDKIKTKIFSYNPYSTEDVEEKQKAIEAVKNDNINEDENGIIIPDDENDIPDGEDEAQA